jgi:fatty-acyl-CoA synthase
VPERDCIVWRDHRFSFADTRDRSRRLAHHLRSRGLDVHRERSELAGHESGQDHVGLYLHNGNEYLEGMLGSYLARVAPFNVNYRYVAEELAYLLKDSGARGLIYHSTFAPVLDEVRRDLPDLEILLQVDDGSGHGLLDGAVDYEEALASSTSDPVDVDRSPDDLYILYTGGTTGMPKGVLWRQADIFVGALGGRNRANNEEWPSMEAIVEAALADGAVDLPAPPFMHGAGHWMAFNCFTSGSAIVLPNDTVSLDPADVWSVAEREKVNIMLIVGDAFARPLLDELDSPKSGREGYDLSSLLVIVSGGAALSAGLKDRFLAHLPNIMVMDGLGSSEAGSQGSQYSAAGASASTGTFLPSPGACIVSEDLSQVIEPGSEDLGWLAHRGRVPLGYLGDEDKTARTFPVIDGERFSVPGDRARQRADGMIELHGRDSVTINSGGEKIFAEEVEAALAGHPAVYDVVVCGRSSERWGQEVVAVVRLREGETADEASLLAEAEKHVSRYKLPKAFVFVDQVVRSPAGKADYRWAKEQAEQIT